MALKVKSIHRIEYKHHTYIANDGKKIKVCKQCTSLINRAFGHTVKLETCTNLAKLSQSAANCPVCRFMVHNVTLDAAALMAIESQVVAIKSGHTVWSVRVNKESEIYFLPTLDGAPLQQTSEWCKSRYRLFTGRRVLLENRWVKHPLYTSGSDYGLALRWLSACQAHPKCQKHRHASSGLKMPTRLIDVGLQKDGSGIHETPKLVIGAQNASPYAALSYRWGGQQPLILTSDNLASFQHGIHWNDFPPLFQDCIMVCRAIKIQYLWIDAVCIIQPESDGGKDFSIECATMQSVYAGSIFTISATSGLSPHHGLFTWRSDQILDRVRPANLKEFKNTGDFSISRSYKDYNPDQAKFIQLANHINDMPISTRVWTLQERFLPAAVLHFYEGQACWECRTALFDDEPETGIAIEDMLNEGVEKSEAGPAKSESEKPDEDLYKPSKGLWKGSWKLNKTNKETQPSSGASQPSHLDSKNNASTPGSTQPPRLKKKRILDEEMDEDLKLILPLRDRWPRSRSSRHQKDFGWWYQIVDMYQKRDVTRAEDRLPAIGGIAAYFAQKLSAKYMAGLWEDDFQRGLLWQRSAAVPPDLTLKAPSWSWARLNGGAMYGAVVPFKVDYGFKHENINVKVIQSPFGEVEEGFIVGQGLLRRIECGPRTRMEAVWPGLVNETRDGVIVHCLFDTISDYSHRSLYLLLIAGGYDAEQSIVARTYFLVLKRLSERHPHFERVGLAWGEWPCKKETWESFRASAAQEVVKRGLQPLWDSLSPEGARQEFFDALESFDENSPEPMAGHVSGWFWHDVVIGREDQDLKPQYRKLRSI